MEKMEENKSAQTEPPSTPPIIGTKHTLCLSAIAQTQRRDASSSDQKTLSKEIVTSPARTALEKEGFMKVKEELSAMSHYTGFKLIYNRHLQRHQLKCKRCYLLSESL
jgi:hypothetical protein